MARASELIDFALTVFHPEPRWIGDASCVQFLVGKGPVEVREGTGEPSIREYPEMFLPGFIGLVRREAEMQQYMSKVA